MPSLIPGYEYDIFISYRQNDNRYDRWVTTFVNDLCKELAATFKEDVTIYFDENPVDGLLSNHDVDDSLKEKIRCLMFISIISQTYCDPKSFAWRKEFLAFRDFAQTDRFGLKVKVANANVSSRIIPVRIHDIDIEDIQLYEKETGTVLRAIDFVFKSPGVNRPLSQIDDRKDNLNHTLYRDQVNKVATAIKEIMRALRATPSSEQHVSPAHVSHATSTSLPISKQKIAMLSTIAILLILLGYISVAYFVDKDAPAMPDVATEKSIAVLPFADMSEQKDQEYFSDGLSEELLNVLAKTPDLKVISRTSAFSFKGKNDDIRVIGQKLGVNYILEGSVRKSGDKLRITAQLIKSSDGSHVWSESFERDMTDIFKVQDEIAGAVVDKLKIQLLGREKILTRQSKPEVYSLWLESKYFLNTLTKEGINKSLQLAEQAYQLDSSDARVLSILSRSLSKATNTVNDVEEFNKLTIRAQSMADRAIQIDPNLSDGYVAMADVAYTEWQLTKAYTYQLKSVELDPSNADNQASLGILLGDLGRYSEARKIFEKTISLDPLNPRGHNNLANLQLHTGEYNDALKNAQKAVELSPTPNRYMTLGFAFLLLKQYDNAMAMVPKMDPDFWAPYAEIIILWSSGNHQLAQKKFDKFKAEFSMVGPFQIAEIYAVQGEEAKVYEWLEQSYKYRDPGLTDLRISPFLKPYENKPAYRRFVDRLEKVSLQDTEPTAL